MTRRRGVGVIGLIALGVVGAGLVYLMYLNPVSGEESVPAGFARNTSSYLPMRDGIQLAADVWVPKDLEADQKLPAIMITTRYWRTHAMGPIYRLLVGVGETHVPNLHMADQWNEAGYALVLVDARGSGASTGERPVEWSDAEVADMGEVTEWITSQPWSNGAVGAVGDLVQRQHGRAEHHAGPPGAPSGRPAVQRLRPAVLPDDARRRLQPRVRGGVEWRQPGARRERHLRTRGSRRHGSAGGSSSRCPG